MEDFVVYMTEYEGDKHPRFYIGSSSLERILKGYKGSPRNEEWKSIFDSEVRTNPHLYHSHILSLHSTREEALEYERE